MIAKHLLICCLVVCVLGAAGNSSAENATDWCSVHVDSLGNTAASFLLRVALLETYTAQYADSLAAGNEWWCIAELLDYYTCRVKQDSAGAANLRALVAGRDPSESSLKDVPVVVDDDILPKVGPMVPKHSGQTWEFWCSLAHLARGAHELGLWDDLDPEVRRVLEELQAAFSPLLEPRDPVTKEPLGQEELLDLERWNERP